MSSYKCPHLWYSPPPLVILFPSPGGYLISITSHNHHEQPTYTKICNVFSPRNMHLLYSKYEYPSSSNYNGTHQRKRWHYFGRILKSIRYIYMGQISYPYSITPTPIIYWLLPLCSLWKKDTVQVNLLKYYWVIWCTKNHSIPNP